MAKNKWKTELLAKLPSIPDKRYFTIGETSHLCGVESHVLRYWEQEFPQLQPMKRRGNRRYYQEKDIQVIRHLCHLLYERGFTIEGARNELSAQKRRGSSKSQPLDSQRVHSTTLNKNALKDLIGELESVLTILK